MRPVAWHLSQEDRKAEARAQRLRWRIVLIVGSVALLAYYAVVVASMHERASNVVPLAEAGVRHPASRVTLQVEAAALDPSTGSFDVRIRPLPRGALSEARGAQLRDPLQVRVASTGEPPVALDFPAGQVIDPVAASLGASAGSHRFPFDRPEMGFRLDALSGGEPVPIDVEMVDETDGWNLAGAVRPDDGGLEVEMGARREALAISFAVFSVAGIAVVGLITVAVIGGATARRQVDFEQVIWLGAMLVAIPAIRNEMPGVPPVGTAVDLFVFLPSVVIVCVALLAAIVVLAINEAAGSASRQAEED
jgi:hypothetical protein